MNSLGKARKLISHILTKGQAKRIGHPHLSGEKVTILIEPGDDVAEAVFHEEKQISGLMNISSEDDR
jgi:hypothetical protein